MGKVNLRSLLVAAIFLSNCISWTQSKHHFRHNVYNHRTRHRRQGAGLFLPASYVIPGGDGSGAWGEWGDVSPCSRTCGGGVASQKRICLEVGSDGRSLCSGGDTKYFSCQTHDCPEGGEDFRSEQCAKYDTQLFKGHSYNWVPYTRAPNPCELNCMPRGERFYYRHELQVVDGTRCNDESFDVCVAGICQPVGCDMMLGSNAKEDKCRQCRGNGTNCYTSTGIIDSQDFRKGYNDVLLIPQGATNIVISEVRSSNNYLALRAQQDNLYYLNGDYHIDFPRSLTIAGSLWYYERSQQGFAAPDKLRSLGPTSEALYLSLLLQEDNVGISYEYSIPSAQAPPPNQQYNWVHEEFSPCNASCGGGIQLRQVSCRSREELEVVEDSLCDKGLKPPTTETCNTGPCPPHWVEGPWSPCTKACGEGGSRSRQVHCEKVIAQGVASIATDKECFDLLGPKPKLYEECNQNASCPTWFTGPWRPCDKLCGEGKQLRQAVCHQRINGRVVVYADEQCTSKKPPTEQSCMLHPCEGVDWVLSDWTGCNTCTSKVRTRTAHCSTKDFQIVKSSFCDYHPMPVLEEPCDPNTLPACELLWYATQWSSCSAECGKGIQTRRVFCGRFDGAGVTVVDDERCDLSAKYNDTKECEVPKEKCPAKWFTGPWTECTKMCGGGEQYRRVKCMRGDKIYSSCDPDVPDSLQTCNLQSCNEDELIPENASSTSIVDDDSDYTDCEEDDYPEEGAEEDALEDLSSEGLHFTLVPENAFEFGYKEGSTEDTDWIDNDKDYTTESTAGTEETGSGSDELFISLSTTDSTDSTTAGTTEYTESVTSIANETVSTESSDTSGETEESATTEDEPESTTELPSGGTDSESRTYGSTDASKITEDSITSESTSETADSTDSTVSESVSTESTDSSMLESASTESTDSSVSESASTESTDSSVSESANTESTDSSVSESASTVSADSSVPESASTLSTDSSVSESASTESTDSSVSEFSSTESTDSSVSESASTESTDSSVSESAGTLSTDSSVSELSSTESTDSSVSESASTESTDSTVFESVGSTESSATETIDATTGSVATESSSDITETTDDTVTKSTFSSTESTTTDATLESKTSHSTETNEVSSIESSTTEFTTESKTTEGFSTNAETETMSETETTEIDFSSITTEATEESDSTVLSSKVTDISDTTIGAETTETGTTESLLTDNGSTESGFSTTEATSESVSTSVTDETTPSSGDTTLWDWSTTVELYARPKCRSRKTAKCIKSKFGCCSDKKTPAAGPFDEGCPNPKTCKETKFGCCPDGVSPSGSLKGKGCPEISCNLTLYGCCTSDNVTTAGGNDQEGCPLPSPACKLSEFGCCNDNETQASGLNQEGCPETATSTPSTSSTSETCNDTEFGCCYDNETDASGPNGAGCPCSISEFGCCPDGISTAQGPDLDGCVMCKTSAYGCCPDDETPAHGPQNEGCCLQSAFGCCPDNYKAAEGPHLEGCDCTYSHYGCCPDNITFARGPNNDGCGCQYTQNGCCADRHTPASGPDFEGCSCHTYQFGCCPDGITASSGPNMEGCLCQTSKYGCCGDDVTGAKGPNKEGCDCSNSKFGCCPDGVTEAAGEKFKNCTDVPENRQAACALATDQGVGYNYSVYWFYDMTYGGCSRFWYKGEDGNGNRFASKEECTAICVSPPAKDVCNLPKVKGACDGSYVKWYYDSVREQCGQFMYGGCLGNDNNFESRELCQKSCEPEKTEDQCNAPIEHGSCAGNFLRWGYNSATQRCSQFIWGGCEGNANRFGSEAACMQRCNPPGALQAECIQPQEIGNCTEKQPVWSFSQTENRCVPFYYTGCGGNDNRFVNEKGCSDNCPSAYVQEICTLPALTGECSEYKLRWFYDTSKRRCRQFYYGGCGGNENNFASERLCEDRCSEQVVVTIAPIATSQSSEFCFLGLDPGPCTRFENRWGYDSSLGDCVQFQYGGCGGNRDNFPSKELCQQYCPPVQDTCQLPMITGPCDGSEMQWFYDTTTATCTQFAYSGCEGNDNRFATREECEHRCKTGSPSIRTTTIATMVVTIECRVSPTLEECEGAGQVWYFDDTLRSCVSHQNVDSGRSCRVTGVFVSQEECERICGAFQGVDVCNSALDPGPCYDAIPKVFYNATSDQCEPFTYSGCLGGPNRFTDYDECESHCRRLTNPCKQEPNPGNCLGEFTKWYYSENEDKCREFVYGGCEGNNNRFDSQAECENRCVVKDATTAVPTLTTVSSSAECHTPVSLQPCGPNVTTYYYDSRTKACIVGDFGACGYANSYRSEEECERRCGAFKQLGDECLQPVSTGEACKAGATRRWFYSQTTGDCLVFIYLGCGGTTNNFHSFHECSVRCTGPTSGCDTYDAECEALQCRYGVERKVEHNNCTRCRCIDHPCANKVCPSGERCAITSSYRELQTQNILYSVDCRLANKAGSCPTTKNSLKTETCRRECNDDADCATDHKCCEHGCSNLCLPPVSELPNTTAYTPDTCQLPMITGPCDGSEMQWFYDATTDSCTLFAYSGCEGNDNRFATREECEHRCKTGSPSIRTTTIATTVVTIECRVSPTLEECEGAGQVWYFDDTLRSCVSHQNVDSGRSCRVTGVFVSQEECERICGAFQGVDVCNSALDPGPCYDAIPKVFYNATSDQCEPFTYSGCLGGPNRFTDYDECESHCRRLTNPCKQEPNPGNCLGEFTKWYYSENEDKCREFVYGGCEGNNNRFDSQAECENRCVVKDATTAVPTLMSRAFSAECHTPVSLQPCGPNVTTYYYDSRTKACIVGDFGACGYANSYRSEEECERRCGAFKQPGGCDTYDAECEALQCRYGVERKVEHNNCTRCRCLDHPCANKVCPSGERCAITSSYRELQTQNILYSVDCRLANKAGSCPTTKNSLKTETCRRECNDDADCATDHKCCEHGCSNLCLPPVSELPNTTAYTPESQLRPEPPVPNINQTEPEVRATEGGKATLRCLFHGNPPPKITWRRGELTISGDIGRYHLKSDGALEIVSLYRNDSGVYICIAQNNLGSATQEVYLQVEDSNEILPPTTDCGDLLEECETLRRQCPYDLLHTYVGQDCVRCSCPQPDPNRCDPFMLECQALICQYGVQSTQANDGCTRCHCNPSPCEGQQCAAGEKCQVIRYRDSITHEIEHFSECREINKIGICPITNSREDCRDECQDDSDCTGVGKCCATGCSHRCIIPEPIPKTSPAPLPTSYLSGIPRAPEVSTDTEQDQRASEDGKATLRCLFHSNPPSKITWRRGEITIDRDIGRYRLHADGTLEIVSVYRNDTGVYICIARNSLGTARNEIRLQVDDPVNGPAGIGNVPNEIIYGNIGEPLDIRCLVFGHPQPSIYWYKGKSGPMIPYSSTLYEARGDVLQIHQLNAETLGEYICLAYNGLEKPAEWAFSVQELIAKPIGNNINTLPPLSSHVSQTEPTTSTQPPYVKVPVYTVPVTTTILAEATQVSAGTVLTVPCEVDGYPVPVVRWSKDNVPLESSDRIQITEARLTISHANTNDSGEYACEASNGYSSHSSTVRIIVEGTYIPPTCKDSPYFANCLLIVRSNYCHHRYYSRFCCKSCLEAGQLDPAELELMQADETYKKK